MLIRVFPRRTKATPTDDLVVINRAPYMWEQADEVHISVTFTKDLPRAEWLEKQWRHVAPVKIGGPALNDFPGEFVPGKYLREGYTITSRGCPNHCWFCDAWKREGTIRELPIRDGWNLLDNNILACSVTHQEEVFQMLMRQKKLPALTGGLEAARLTPWHVEWLVRLKPSVMWFAYDTPDDYEPLVSASKMLHEAELMGRGHSACCYVLIGYEGDTFDKAEKRLMETIRLGFFPQAMLYENEDKTWKRFQREWANKVIVGSKMKSPLPVTLFSKNVGHEPTNDTNNMCDQLPRCTPGEKNHTFGGRDCGKREGNKKC